VRGISRLTKSKETPNTKIITYNKQTLGDKILCQEGNSPDYLLRSLNFFLVRKEVKKC
jgi:hypothetical protein